MRFPACGGAGFLTLRGAPFEYRFPHPHRQRAREPVAVCGLVRAVMDVFVSVAVTHAVVGLVAAPQNPKVEQYPYDAAKAKAALDAAGYPDKGGTRVDKDGKPLAFELLYANNDSPRNAELVVSQERLYTRIYIGGGRTVLS